MGIDAGAAPRRVARSLAPAVAIIAAQQVLFPAPGGIVVRGLIVGGLTALIAIGMALVYRANRILNFAQADLGFGPAVLAYLLIDEVGVPWVVAVVVGLVTAAALGGATEAVVIRRFFRAPRLLVTIATIGLSQVLAAGALLLPRLWDRRLVSERVPTPFDSTARIGGVVFDANDLLALVVTPLLVTVVAVTLQRSAAGTAVRAAADDADRASLLGIPVHRLHTLVWASAAVLAFATMFLRGGILGLPTGTVLGFSVLLRSLVALVVGRLTDLVAVAGCAVALGVLELSISWEHSIGLIDPILGVIVVIALVIQRRDLGGSDEGDAGAWQVAEEVRPVPPSSAGSAAVRLGRWAIIAAAVGVAAALPHVLAVDRSLRASAVLIYAILGLSLVVLSGWGGLVSLGHVAFFAIGAAVCGWVTSTHGGDLVSGLVIAAAAGAVAAAVIGIPASRLRGLALAVTTFAFSLATTSWLLNEEFFDWVPRQRIERAPLFGGLDVATPVEVFYLALAMLLLVGFGVRGIRASRTGRALVALRDNDRTAQSFGIHPTRLRVGTFALSGGIAALAGGLFVHHQQAFDPSTYSPIQNLAVFTMVVVGGLTSVTGAILGALFFWGTRYYLPGDWQILASGVGVLVVLWLAPGGLAALLFRGRDALLGAAGPEPADRDSDAPPAPPPAQREGTKGGLLDVDDLEVGYGPVQVLFGVDLHVASGEVVALLGTNGAGKSTLLRAVSGLLAPDAGTIRFDGQRIEGRPPHAVARLGIAQMPGGRGVFPTLSVEENLRTAGWTLRKDPASWAAAREQVGRLFPALEDKADQRAGSLSGGEQQMLALAMALATRPRLLLIDELSLGLAPVVVARLLRAVEELRVHTTMVLVDQSVDVALEVADRAVFMERGTVRFAGPAHELLERRDLLRSVFLGGAAAARPREGAPVATEGAPVLEAAGVSVSFGGVTAVDSVSLSVRPGEIVGVVGPNGAGKTTLFDILSGFLAPAAGTVRLLGRDVTRASAAVRAEAGLARSFQDARLFPSLTVEETVATACERWVKVRDPLSAAFRLPNVLASERAVADRVDELLALFELGGFRTAFVGELSTGTRRVVDLACLVAHQPDVVLLDEPAAGIAQREVEALAPLIRRIRDETGASLVVVEHDIPLIQSVADRLVAMGQGQVVAEGRPGDVLAHAAVIEAYLGTDDAAVGRSDAPSRGGPDATQP